LAWAGKCTHWNKFSSIASLGLIHKNHKDKSVFKSFLPGGDGNASNHYQNGGALYGLGLLFTGTGNNEIIQYIIDVTTNPAHNQNEVIMHGACLGLGLTGFATGN
jgi:26S proteasome regulatory subunit N2